MCFSFFLKSDTFSARNLYSLTVYHLHGWNKHHFIGNWMPYTRSGIFFCFPSVSIKKNTKHWKIYIKTWKVGKNVSKYCSIIYFSKILKTLPVMLCSKALQMKYNHQFCSICEVVGEDRFSAGPPKSQYFLCKSFSLDLTEKVYKQTMFRTSWYICFV